MFPLTHTHTDTQKGGSSDDENALPTRSGTKGTSGAGGRNGETSAGPGASGREELDSSVLINADEARRKFRKAERKRGAVLVGTHTPSLSNLTRKKKARSRTRYAYPPSPDSPTTTGVGGDPTNHEPRPVPLSHRLRALQAELAALELEIADPSNPLLLREREENHVDPGELIRGLVDVRGRLDKIRKGKEGRGKLVGMVAALGEGGETNKTTTTTSQSTTSSSKSTIPDIQSIVDLDRRMGELEKLVGSSSAALDDVRTVFLILHTHALTR